MTFATGGAPAPGTPTSNAEEAEVEWFYEALQEDVPELTPKMKSFSSKGIVMQK